jgi:hypothetical protein
MGRVGGEQRPTAGTWRADGQVIHISAPTDVSLKCKGVADMCGKLPGSRDRQNQRPVSAVAAKGTNLRKDRAGKASVHRSMAKTQAHKLNIDANFRQESYRSSDH